MLALYLNLTANILKVLYSDNIKLHILFTENRVRVYRNKVLICTVYTIIA